MINKERLINEFLRLAAINSPGKRENAIADILEADLRNLGFAVVRDRAGEQIGGDTGNVIATKKGNVANAVPILFSAHMDTVAPTDKLEFKIEGDTISSAGDTILGADDKAGIAAIMEAMYTIVEREIPHGDIQIAFSIAEESGLWGAKHMDYDLISSKMAFVYDSGKPVCGIVLSAPSHDNIIAKIHGKAAHAGVKPEDGVNAITAASKAIANMKIGRIDYETTSNIGVISGGTARNVVPDYCEVRGEARSRNSEKLDSQIEHMVEAFHEAAAEMGAGVDIEINRSYLTYRHTQEDEIIKIASEASRRVGIEPVYEEAGGGSDANIFNENGFPSVVIGVGYESPHSVNETLYINEFVKSSEMAVELVKVAAGG